MINKAKLWLDSGKIFETADAVSSGSTSPRPRATLTEALERILDAMKSR